MREEPEFLKKLRDQRQKRKSNLSLLHVLAGSDSPNAIEGIRFLLQNNECDVDEREDEGITALHVAANWDNLAMCQTLISYGANPQLEDEEGRTALDLATGKTREFLLKYHRLPKKKRHSLIRRFLTVMRPSKTSVVRCGPRRLCRSLGGCLIGLSGQPSLTDESEGSPVEKSPEAVKNEPEEKGEPKKSLAKNPAQGDAAPEKPEIGVQKPIYDSQGDEFHDALEEVNVTARKKKNSKSPAREPPVFAVPKLPSRPKRPPASETPLETTLEYLTCSEDEEDTIVIPAWIEKLSDRHLRMHLEDLKQRVGPITTETRLLYRRRLALMKKDATSKSSAIYSAPLQRLLEGKPPTVGLFLDKKVREAFRSDIASPHQRQGNSAAFFCYLLIDPTLVYAPAAECSFQDFVTAVFYVGKGKKSRPVQHLVDAAKSRSSAIPKSDKLKRILSLWDAGRGVVSLQVFQNVISVESHCREGAMLEAIGIRNLTNLKRGEYYDICIQWTSRQREEFGTFLLLSAWKIFRIEGSREIFEKDVL